MNIPIIETTMEGSPHNLVVGLTKFQPNDLLTDDGIESPLYGWPDLDSVIPLLPKISLEEMTGVKLMNRIDIKYMVKASTIPVLIKKVINNYHIQEIDSKRVADYRTIYLDTKELLFYHSHMNGKLNHIKWRIRSYIESNLCFLEIKKKTNTGRTLKNRIVYNPTEGLNKRETIDFIRETSGIEATHLHPVLENSFNRLTLVNNNKTERLTIDFNISFRNCLNGKSVRVHDLAIIEIKQNRLNESVMREYIGKMRIKKSSISKYCLGIALTSEHIKRNLYKRKIRYINKITRQK